MATTAITPVIQTLNTASADIPAAGTVASTPADGWVITPPAKAAPASMCLIFEADGSGDTVTILAGDNPPSHLAAAGNLTVTLAASDLKFIWIEPQRFMQDDGTILATCSDAGTRCYVIVPPIGIAGGTGIA